MKKAFLLFNLLIISNLSFAQGIQFEPTIESAFQKALASNKLVFVECYHPNCPICMSLEPTLKNAEVGKFYSQNFESFKLNLSDANHVKFLNSHNIRLPGFPMFLYFDKNENLLYLTDGEKSPESFISKAKDALNPEKQSTTFKGRFAAGERNSDFLIAYGYFSRVMNDTTANYKVVDELYKAFPKDQLSSEMSWAITKKMVMDVDNGFAQYWFEHLPTAKKYEGEHHPDGEKNAMGTIIQSSLYSLHGQNYSLVQVEKIKKYMNAVGAGQYVAGVTWQHEARALFREGQPDKALTVVNNISHQFANNGQALTYLVKFLNDNAANTKYLITAQSFLAKAKPLLKENKDLAELNYETALMYKNAGDKANAQKAANEAKKMAVLAKLDANGLQKFDDLLTNIK